MLPQEFRFLCVLLLMGVLSSACSGMPLQTATFTPIPSATVTLQSSSTPTPTETSSPSLEPTATFTLTPTPSATPTETPMPIFAGFQMTYVTSTSYGLSIGFRVPGIKENYRLTIGDREFTCSLNPKAPDQLNCAGPQVNPNQEQKLSFYKIGSKTDPVYTTTAKLATLMKPTLNEETQVAMGKACLLRGVHVTCETELRKTGNDSSCTVSTCVDLCGYYYSVDTCPEGAEKNGFVNITGTPPNPTKAP